MDQLIQTKEYAFIYGNFKGKENQMLFQCPRETEVIDLTRYINEHRALVGQMESRIPFEDDSKVQELRNIEGKEMVGYYRMYYSGGWCGRWLYESKNYPDRLDCYGVQQIIDWFVKEFPKGCTFTMDGFFRDRFKNWGGENRFLVKPFKSEFYKVMIDTTYMNGDYPVRIYCYKKKGEC